MLKSDPIQANHPQATDLQTSGAHRSWQYSHSSRYRWNVLDLLELFGRKALTAHLLIDIDMEWAEQTRKRFEEIGQRVTVTAFLIKSISIAQKDYPASRTFALPGSRKITYEDVVAGFTVERMVDGEPIVFFGEIEQSQEKSLLELADALEKYSKTEIMELPKLRQQVSFAQMPWLLRQAVLNAASWLPQLRHMCMRATFGLSNLGSLGMTACFGPSVCTSVFGVGAVADRVIVRAGELKVGTMMTLALSFDQRAMDAEQAALFLRAVKLLMEGGLAKYID